MLPRTGVTILASTAQSSISSSAASVTSAACRKASRKGEGPQRSNRVYPITYATDASTYSTLRSRGRLQKREAMEYRPATECAKQLAATGVLEIEASEVVPYPSDHCRP